MMTEAADLERLKHILDAAHAGVRVDSSDAGKALSDGADSISRKVDGLILVTPAEYDTLISLAAAADPNPPLGDGSLFGIPIAVVHPLKPLTLPSGRIAVTFDNTIYLLPPGFELLLRRDEDTNRRA